MAFYDRRTMDGVYSVRQGAIYVSNYRYAEERMMRMMAGWIALTPEINIKLEMARQVYEDALHADALGKRLPELRAQIVSKPPNDQSPSLAPVDVWGLWLRRQGRIHCADRVVDASR